MNSKEFKEVIATASVAGPVAEQIIQDAEKKLSLLFPDEYRTFLKEYGAILGIGFEIAGIFAQGADDEPPLWRDVVKATLQFRKYSNRLHSDSLIPIADDGCDITYYVDAKHQGHGRCPVVAYGPGIDGRTVSQSVEEFVVELARNGLRR